MKLTIHGQLLAIPDTLARYARQRIGHAFAGDYDRIRSVTLRLVGLRPDAPPHWVAVIDLGAHGSVVTRVRALDRLAAIDELARRAAESVAHRLATPPRMTAPAPGAGRVVTRMRV